MGMDDFRTLSQVLVHCYSLDSRIKKFNCKKLSYDELIEEQLERIKEYFSYILIELNEYKCYYHKEPKIVEKIQESIDIMLKVIKNSEEERANLKYNQIIELLLQYKKIFFKETSEEEQKKYVKEYIIKDMGKLILEIDEYRRNFSIESKDYKDLTRILMQLCKIINNTGEQRKIKLNEEIQKSINEKSRKYYLSLVENND